MESPTPGATSSAPPIHRLAAEEVLLAEGSAPEGLTAGEAAARLAGHGPNTIREPARRPPVLALLAEFTGPMALLLWVAGAIALVAGLTELGVAVFIVVIINGVFAFWQEYRAERATEELQKMLSPHATVVRDGALRQVPSEELVPGDLVVIAEGDRISADARLIESADLQVDQSTLTGESRPVRKNAEPMTEDVPAAQRTNMVFTGTSVGSGDGRAVVTATGMDTEFGRIADLTQSVQEGKSPLQKQLSRLTLRLSILAVVMGASFTLMAIAFVHQPWGQAFIFGLAMIVAFVPEGLLPTVTLSLALAVQRMAKRNALVKRLSSVETLGCTTVICSDKTGTLTQNEMTVTRLWLPGTGYEVTGRGYTPAGQIRRDGTARDARTDAGLRTLLTAASLCNNAGLTAPTADDEEWSIHGDPTEACLLVAAAKAGLAPDSLLADEPRLRELTFDSLRKRMTTLHRVDGRCVAYTKGSPQGLAPLCSAIIRDGVRRPMTAADRQEVAGTNDALARQGLRVLAVATRTLDAGIDPGQVAVDQVERDLTFLGLVAMEDPPREGITESVELCHRASIRVIMITGDYGLTAQAIAQNIGLVHGDDARVITGPELEDMSEAALSEALREPVIFARAAPEQKYRVVATLQGRGEIVAVTGDGVNDAPALKKADIGIAMGTGTDVSKEAADIILTDDHFASIVRAIQEGRSVYDNIGRFLTYILTSNMAEAVPSAVFVLSRGIVPLPLTVMQILTIDLGTDLLPALGLGTERPERGVMDRPPRSRTARLMNRRVLALAFGWYGLLEAVFAMAAFLLVNVLSGWPGVPLADSGEVYARATTMTLAAIIFGQIGAVLGCRTSRESLLKVGILSNRRVLGGIAVEVVLLAALSYLPSLQRVFGTGPLLPLDWAVLAVLPVLVLLLDELRKGIIRRRHPAQMVRNEEASRNAPPLRL